MLQFFKGTNAYQLIVWAIIIAGTIFSIFPPDALFFRIGAKFVVQIMFAYLALGMIFLMVGDSKSMFISFGCCVILCLFLRNGSPPFTPPMVGENITVATINLSNSSDNADSTINMILETNADIIAVQEIDLDWNRFLKSNPYINKIYPYDTSLISLNFSDMTILSRYPFLEIDTFHYENIPNFIGSIQHDSLGKKVHFISAHATPSVSVKAYREIYEHLQLIGEKAKAINEPTFVLGDFQVVPWSSEILSLEQKANLKNSRREMPTAYFPHDHILYSKHLECLGFSTISSEKTTHLGILGKYQLSNEQQN